MWADFLNIGFNATLWFFLWQYAKTYLANREKKTGKASPFLPAMSYIH